MRLAWPEVVRKDLILEVRVTLASERFLTFGWVEMSVDITGGSEDDEDVINRNKRTFPFENFLKLYLSL